jgi:two-component system phosphate regulon sensor histidine kinase PhoR
MADVGVTVRDWRSGLMKKRILIFSCLLAGFSIILTAISLNVISYYVFYDEMCDVVRTEAGLIVAGVDQAGEGYLETLAPAMESRVTLISADGYVVFDNKLDPLEMEDHSARPEFQQALIKGIGEASRYSSTLSKKTFYFALRTSDGFVLRVSRINDSIFTDLLSLFPIVIISIIIMIIIAIIVSRRVTNFLVKPINQLDLNAPEENVVYDELAPLLSRMRRQNEIIAEQMAEIKQKQLEFTAITENMREGLLVLDNDAYVLSCNKSALRLLRTRPNRSVRQSALAFNRSDGFTQIIEKAMGGDPAESILKIGDRSIHLIANPVKEEDHGSDAASDKPPKGIILFLLDVTEREDREKLRREFTANVSHELKTPLTSISGYAEIITKGVAKPEDIPRFTENIYSEAKHLITLIGDIMSLSKLDDQNSSLAHENVNLYRLAEGVLRRLKEKADQKNVAISLEGVDSEIPGVRQALDEIVYNLVDNAIKYNRMGGSVDVSLEDDGRSVFIAVKDTGIGIPFEEQERIFERFYRVDKSRNGAIEGTGLGLSIVKHSVQLHGGEVSVDSDGSTGTRVTVRLPKIRSFADY